MTPFAFIQNLSSWEIVLIFLVVLLFFGAKRLPELFRSFGKSMKEFKKATTEIEEDIRSAMEDEPKPSTSASKQVDTQVVASTESEDTSKA
ncbi:MAG: twin-arginine translocase TatA/TatE family subunit [Verrucomicrobiota bacterium]